MARKRKSQTRGALIQAYGLFWREDEIDWTPGKGKRYDWRLYGRRGGNSETLQVADFRHQKGIYILYGNYGPHYVGLTRETGLGARLKDHRSDKHAGLWDRFSWFGFRAVLKQKDDDGIHPLKDVPVAKSTNPNRMIADIEALLIKSMALKNINKMKFDIAEEWTQIKRDELERYKSWL